MPLFDEGDTNLLKKWIVQRLEDISDADADVLADYVLALLRHEQGENEVKQMCTDQLSDFLQEHTSGFVNDVFNVIKTKGYLSVNSTLAGALAQEPVPEPTPSSNLLSAAPLFSGSGSMSTLSAAAAPYVPRSPGRSTPRSRERSRSPEDHDMNPSRREREREPLSMDRDSYYSNDSGQTRGGYNRQRRGGRNADGQFDGGGGGGGGGRWQRGGDRNRGWRGNDRGNFGQGHQQQQQQQPQMGQGGFGQPPMPGIQLPGMPPMQGMPWGQDPMSQFLAAQAAAAAAAAAGWTAAPAMPGYNQQPPGSPPNRKVPKQHGKRCRDYDNKGYCAKGDMCPYEHGGSNAFAAQGEQKDDEYDPNNSLLLPHLMAQQQQQQQQQMGQDQGRGRGRGGRGFRGGRGGQRGGRSEMSSTTNYERKNVPLVIENIPDDKLNEASVRDFFSKFGNIEAVEFQHGRNMATLKFQTHDMARSAFESPAPIFDNRFVKVFWLKHELGAGDGGASGQGMQGMQGGADAAGGDGMEIDEAEFAKKQEEAQKVYEEKQAKKKANEELAKDLERRKEELVKQQQEQKRLLLEKLAKKHAEASPSVDTPEENGGVKSEAEAKRTAALKAQLEALEAEAASLGIDHSKLDQPLTDTSPYSRGRGGYRGRGTYPYRATTYSPYRATRGGFGFPRGGRVMNKLDNRTKKISVAGVDGSHDEELRQYLLLNSEFESIDPHPTATDSQIITFKDRATAEKFFYSSKEIPNIGKVELTWFNAPGSASGSGVGSPMPAQETKADDVEMGGNVDTSMDEFDVAEDDERRWG